MRDYKTMIDLETSDKFVSKALELGLQVEMIEGVLNDDYLIFNNNRLSANGIKARKYIIIYAQYRNSQSNDLYLLMTDKEEKATQFMQRQERELAENEQY